MNDTIAVYQGKKYSAGYKTADIIILRSTDEQEVKEKGFTPLVPPKGITTPFKGVKYVSKDELSELYQETARITYKGYKGLVIAEEGDKIEIWITNLMPEDAEKLQMDRATDHGTYTKLVNKDEVTIEIERRSLL